MSSDGNPELTGLEPQDKPTYGSTTAGKEDGEKLPHISLAMSSPGFIPASLRSTTAHSKLAWQEYRKQDVSLAPASHGILHSATVWMSLLIGGFAVLGIKVAAFSISGSQMVKTTMFGSCGDALSGAILLLTQRNSRRSDVTKFPAGKGRFEPLGILVFSVFIAALMTCQVLTAFWHVAGVDERDAVAGMQMLWKGHPQNVYTPNPYYGDAEVYNALQNALQNMPTESQRDFRAEASSVDWKLVDMSRNDREKAMGRIMDEIGELVELGDIHNLKQRCQLVCMLLAVVLVSKALLGVFCRYFVYPRTRSYMMIALAYDHFYDAVAQVFVISVNAIVFIWRGRLGWLETRLDAICSIIFAASIIAHWIIIVIEQLTYLSGYAADPAYYEDIARAATSALTSENSKFQLDAVKAYHFGRKHLVELDIVVPDSSTPHCKVREVVESLKVTVGEVEDVEKVFVNVAPSKYS